MNVKLHGNETVLLEMSENGQLEIKQHTIINRGLLFGDGLFETMIFSNRRIRFKEAHQARLIDGCEVLQLETANIESLDICEAYLIENFPHHESIRIRWNVYRAGMGRYSPETNHTAHLFILQNHIYSPPVIKSAYITQIVKVPSLPWSNCKTLNALVYVTANLERQKKQYDEVILLNSEGYICEAGAANLFWIKDGIYYTPSLRSHCIAGIGRKVIIKELRNQDIKLIKGEFKPKDLLSADQVFTSNVTGINYISKIDMREFDTTPFPFLEELFL